MEKLICNAPWGKAKNSCFARVAALALVGTAFSARAAEPAALTLALQGDNVVVTVPVNSCDDTSKLYLVWDGVDRGADLSSWSAAKRIQYLRTRRRHRYDVERAKRLKLLQCRLLL